MSGNEFSAEDEVSLEDALSKDDLFIADLYDKRFAHAAFWLLISGNLVRWDGKPTAYFGTDAVAYMIVRLRGLREQYIDFKLGPIPAGEPSEEILYQKALSHLGRLGWRKRSKKEWHAIHFNETREHLAMRVRTLRKVKEFESRPQADPEDWVKSQRWTATVYSLLLAGDVKQDELGPLSPEEIEAVSEELGLRIIALAKTGRINQEEYRRLKGGLGFKLLGEGPPY